PAHGPGGSRLGPHALRHPTVAGASPCTGPHGPADVGRPPGGGTVISAPGAAMLDDKLFVCRDDNPFPDLYERWWDGVEWIWVNHGRPGGERVWYAPGAAMANEKLFVVTETGKVWERHWRA